MGTYSIALSLKDIINSIGSIACVEVSLLYLE